MNGGIRPGIWIAAAAALIVAIAVACLALPRLGSEPDRQPRRSASPNRDSAAPPFQAMRADPAAARPSSPSLAASQSREARPSPIAEHLASARSGPSAAPAPVDSRAAADLRILEDEAARRAEELGIVGRAEIDAATANASSASGSGESGEDARRGVLSDAFVLDQLTQEIYRSTLYPNGFPAEERARAFAETLVRQTDRIDLLERLLQEPPAERIGPQIAAPDSGYVWENAIR
jgi:hypothetical protein